MRRHLGFAAVLLASASLAVSTQAATNLAVNGSFEIGVDPAGQATLNGGDVTSLPGWTVLARGVDYADTSAWDAADDSRSVERSDAKTATNMLYGLVTNERVAGSTIQDVQFRSVTSAAYGPVIDSVDIAVVPEASIWAMSIAGFGLVGVLSRGRSRGSVSA